MIYTGLSSSRPGYTYAIQDDLERDGVWVKIHDGQFEVKMFVNSEHLRAEPGITTRALLVVFEAIRDNNLVYGPREEN